MTVARVDVAGGDPDFAAATADIVNPLAGRTISVAELYEAAAKIEALYARSNRILTRATVPPQRISNGSVFKIVIVEGFIESVDAKSISSNVRKPVEARTALLVGRKGLTLAQIERQLLLAARLPGVALKSTLIPGKELGGAVLVIEAEYRPIDAALSVDNRLGSAYDNWNFDTQLVLNSVMGAGEQIYAVASTGSDFKILEGQPLRRIAGLGAILPLGSDGLTFNAEYLRADTNAEVPSGAAPLSGKLDRVALRLRHPLVLTRKESLNLSVSFDVLDESQSIRGFDITLSADRLRYLTLGIDGGKALASGGVVSGELSVSRGFQVLGARTQADAARTGLLLSRFGSQPDFAKANVTAAYRTGLGGGFDLALIGRGQVSLSGALPSAAMFSLDAVDGLSGFDLGSINVDSGSTGRAELAHPLRGKNYAVAPYLFGAVGVGRLSQPTVLERKNVDGWSLGAGLRASLGRGLTASAELSRSRSNIFAEDDTRLITSVSFRF
ncbi:MAG: ShlB/FhaC/HecB family hemolysin secretion/activation protein [Sphingorhabdus sp.]